WAWGIAVGLATNIPPHNLGEVCRAASHLIDNPDASTAQLMDRVKGPDFPLGGKIIADRATLRRIYEEGQGTIKVQGEWKLEQGKRPKIVITSIPYGVNKGQLENDMGAIIEARKLPQVTGLTNETNDKEELRIALDGKADAAEKLMKAFKLDEEQTAAILDAQLYKIAQMEIRRIRDELRDKAAEAARIEGILKSKAKLWGVIKTELTALVDKYGDRRR